MDKDKKDEKKVEKPIDKPVVKSWNQMRKEAKSRARDEYIKKMGWDKKEEKDEKTAKVDLQPSEKSEKKEEAPVEVKTETPPVDVDALVKRASEETATKVAEATRKEFQEKIDQILNKDKDIQDKQKEADELVASWTKENRLPKNYDELIAESLRIADAKMTHRQRELEVKAKEVPVVETPKTDPNQTKLEDFQKQIVSDLQDIYEAKFLPKPANIEEINNPNTTDAAARETQKVLEFGVKLNTERVKQGLPAVTSLNKIYFIHYKPMIEAQGKKSDQPPGADAPVSPSRNQSVTQQNSPKPFYQKGEDGHYHPKSWAQIKYEALKAKAGR